MCDGLREASLVTIKLMACSSPCLLVWWHQESRHSVNSGVVGEEGLGEEPLEALAVTNQGDSMFLSMHAELGSAMHASGVTAVACMNLD